MEEHGINAMLGRAPMPGEPAWERAVGALDLTYVNSRIIAMGMPYDRRQELIDKVLFTLSPTPFALCFSKISLSLSRTLSSIVFFKCS
jgi:hypothetical protein